MIGMFLDAGNEQVQLQQFHELVTSTPMLVVLNVCYVAFAVLVFVRLRRWSDVPGRTTLRAVVVTLGLLVVLEVFTRNPWVGWFLWAALASAWVYYGLAWFRGFVVTADEGLRLLASRRYRRERRQERESARQRAAELEATLAAVERERRTGPKPSTR